MLYSEGSPSIKRTDQEVAEIKGKIAFLYRTFSEMFDTRVVPGSGWACGLGRDGIGVLEQYMAGEIASLDKIDPEIFRPRIFVYPEKALETWSMPSIIGATRHELGHAIHTDYRVLFRGQKQAKDEGYLPTTWANIWNANEDPWVNNREMAGSLAARQNLEHLYQEILPEVLENINSQPPIHQLGLNINHYWLTGESIPTLENEQVLAIFNEIKTDCETYFFGETAEENYELLQAKIWDEVKVLEEQGIQESMLKRMIEAASGEEFGEPGQERKGAISRIVDRLRGAGRRSIDEQLRQKMPRSLEESLQREFERQAQDAKVRIERKELEEPPERLPLQRTIIEDFDLTQLPDDIRVQLERVVEKLEEELRKQLEKEAVSRLDEKQAEALKDSLPASVVPEKDETGEYQLVPDFVSERSLTGRLRQVERVTRDVQSQEDFEAAQHERLVEELERQKDARVEQGLLEFEMRQAGFDPEETGSFEAYQEYLELERSIRPQINQFVRRFEPHLPKKTEYVYGGTYYSGPRTDWGAVSKKIPIGKYDIQKRPEAIETPEARLYVWLVVDRSGSMAGEKMHESLKTAIFLAESLGAFEVPLSIDFFGDSLDNLLRFGQDYDDPRIRAKPKLVEMSDASGVFTDLSAVLVKIQNEMAQARRMFPTSFGSAYVISDGEANHGITGEPLREMIEEMQKGMRVYGFDLSGRGEVKRYFGEDYGMEVSDFSQLPSEAYGRLSRDLDIFTRRHRLVS